MNVIHSLFGRYGGIAVSVGDYLVSHDSAHLGAEPSFPETRVLQLNEKRYKYWETLNRERYYGVIETKTGYGISQTRVWYDMKTSEPRAKQNAGEPVCFLDSGIIDKPHRIGAPAWGEAYYIDGFRFPPEIGKTFRPDVFYTMTVKDNQLVFGPGNLHVKYTKGQLIIHGDPVVVPQHEQTNSVSLGWGMYKTVRELIREFTIPAFDHDLPGYIASTKTLSWGY